MENHMTLEKRLFVGVGAFTTAYDSVKKLVTFASSSDPTPNKPIDFTKVVTVDLSKTPNKVASPWPAGAIELDDRGVDATGITLSVIPYPNGILASTIAPDSPNNGGLSGTVYLEYSRFKNEYKNTPWPPTGYREHELTTIAYSAHVNNGTKALERFVGFHARMEDTGTTGTHRLLKLTVFGQGELAEERARIWVDYDDPNECDNAPLTDIANAPAYPLLTPGSPAKTTGAVYLNMKFAARFISREYAMRGPKLPVNMG